MSLATFKAIVDKTFADKRTDVVEFDFHGGEVGLVFNQLRCFCEWLWSRKRPKPYRCFATTNGTLIHGKVKEWFERNASRFCLGLSLDGTKEMHDVNRSESYDLIEIPFFRKTWPRQGCKMTVSPLTLPHLYDGIVHLYNLGFDVSVNLAYGVGWDDSLMHIYEAELGKLVQFFLAHSECKVPNLLSFPVGRLGHIILTGSDPEPRWCGSGRTMVCYAPNGDSFPCQMFMSSCGCDSEKSKQCEALLKSSLHLVDDKCKECFLRGTCPTCYGQNLIHSGRPDCRSTDMCKFRKAEAMATAKLLSLKLCRSEKGAIASKSERQRLAAGILAINRGFKSEKDISNG